MITPSSIQYVTQMLNEPQSVNDVDMESINSIKEAYPYFVPARYMECADRHKKQPYSPSMMANMQLYMGNWLLFCDFLQQSLGDKQVAPIEYGKEKEENTSKIFEEGHKDNFEVPEEIIAPVQEEHEAEELHHEDEVIHEPEDIEEAAHDEPEHATVVETHIPEEVHEEAEEEVHETTTPSFNFAEDNHKETDETLILPIYTEDYFLHQGIDVSNDIPEDVEELKPTKEDEDKSLMVVMSFSEWLNFFKTTTEKEKEEHNDKKALKTMWQKEKLAAALEEENEEIPENVFEMAVNSIAKEEDLASEPLAEIYIKQGKYDTAIDMYRKLSLRNPQKSAYFARKIEAVLKEKQS